MASLGHSCRTRSESNRLHQYAQWHQRRNHHALPRPLRQLDRRYSPWLRCQHPSSLSRARRPSPEAATPFSSACASRSPSSDRESHPDSRRSQGPCTQPSPPIKSPEFVCHLCANPAQLIANSNNSRDEGNGCAPVPDALTHTQDHSQQLIRILPDRTLNQRVVGSSPTRANLTAPSVARARCPASS